MRIIPYLVAILVAVAMLRASGALDLLIRPLGAITAPLGLPAEALLMGMLRALSGSGAFAYLASLLNDPAIGPDSYTGYLVSTIQGSTETTFYVLAVYFGAVGVDRMRHAVVVGTLRPTRRACSPRSSSAQLSMRDERGGVERLAAESSACDFVPLVAFGNQNTIGMVFFRLLLRL